ncbi:sugar ABC transporter substrate-binding protein [Aquibium sp. A9E412]|uniref:sugar ABC transporter substrate-binding protein n=1 Tax=Aquibium sp. A9E412 TaxID=2976767 RepID=UPI0025B0A3EB|nr:sugar ABC transporter substrate-binding protein [Aquibium sp. A9E412]MDN2568316.1 sugar ABC transporter substrate-binding protein [Aquibium sp. A9E412]
MDFKQGSVTSAAAILAASFAFAGSAGAQEANLDKARALLDEARQLPKFEAPGEAFDAKACMADKKVYVIPLTTENPFNVEIGNAQKQAAEAVGFDITVSDNQLNIDQWVQAIQTAIADGYDVIDIQGGVPPEAIGPQLAEARDAGVKIVATHLYDVTQEPSELIDGNFAMNYSRAGELMAAWAMDKTDGNVNAVIIGSDEIIPTGPFVAAIQEYLDTNCPDCKHKYVNVPVVEWGSQIQPEVQSALVADPDINYILPIYDSMSAFIVPALTLSNREDVRIATYNGTPFVLDLLRDGDLVEMNVGESLAWVGWAGIDGTMRLLCDEGEVTELNTPLYIFDDSNVETAGVPAGYDQGYGDGHVNGFRKLWGLD